MCNFSSSNLSYSLCSAPWHVLFAVLGPLAHPNRSTWPHCSLRPLRRPKLKFGKLPPRKMHIWEIATWKVALEKILKIPNTIFIRVLWVYRGDENIRRRSLSDWPSQPHFFLSIVTNKEWSWGVGGEHTRYCFVGFFSCVISELISRYWDTELKEREREFRAKGQVFSLSHASRTLEKY